MTLDRTDQNQNQNPNPKPKPIILIADDDKFILNIFKKHLKKSGYEVLLAANGQEALDIIQKTTPDLLLVDLIMPVKDGFEVVQKVRGNPDYKNIKIVVLSNLGQEEDVKKVRKMGVDGYIIKSSVSLDLLEKQIKRFLEGG